MKPIPGDQYNHLRCEIQQKISDLRKNNMPLEEIDTQIEIMKAHLCVFISDETVVNEIFDSASANRTFNQEDVSRLEKQKKETMLNRFGVGACVTRH
jgi:hypothetical protein